MSDELTDERLAEIEARANAATRGPWAWNEQYDGSDDSEYPSKLLSVAGVEVWDGLGSTIPVIVPRKVLRVSTNHLIDDKEMWIDLSVEDGQFIAKARQDVPDLVAEVRRLRLAVAQYQGESK